MATRSLTEVYIMLRNNALQSRHIYSDQMGDRTALVNHDDTDIELGNNGNAMMNGQCAPRWSDDAGEIQYEISKIQKKMKELSVLHDRHLNRPTLDDSAEEERAIDTMTEDITQMFYRCQRLVQKLSSSGNQAYTQQEQQLNKNMSSSVARSLQETSTQFRINQSAYLRKLRGREERSKQYFDINLLEPETSVDIIDQRFTATQLQMLEDNTLFVEQREKEILHIVKSIQALNDIFKDLSSMVVDQGTILDRIDYNVESSSVSVERGLEQLQKAEKYQKHNRKMVAIIAMFVTLVVLLIILLAWKT